MKIKNRLRCSFLDSQHFNKDIIFYTFGDITAKTTVSNETPKAHL